MTIDVSPAIINIYMYVCSYTHSHTLGEHIHPPVEAAGLKSVVATWLTKWPTTERTADLPYCWFTSHILANTRKDT